VTEHIYDAAAMLRAACARHEIHLSVLVAETGLWASPEVHRRLTAENGTGTFFPNMRRYRAGQGEQRGGRVGEVRLDDNSYANHAIKRAVGIARERLVGFEACHIWPLSCYDERYHTAVANLVLLPRALAGLSDHDEEIRAALQFRAFELYGWYPSDASAPVRPTFYPTEWRAPEPFSSAVERALAGRRSVGGRVPG
jgi:hypothetical protein